MMPAEKAGAPSGATGGLHRLRADTQPRPPSRTRAALRSLMYSLHGPSGQGLQRADLLPASPRWLVRYLEERAEATIEEAAIATSCLTVLGAERHEDAAVMLRATAERATRQPSARGVG
jgi:hypothetical protein